MKLGENSPDFRITASTDSDLLLEQKIVDTKFYGVASEEKLQKVYQAKMWIDEEKKEVKYQEILADRSSVMGLIFQLRNYSSRRAYGKGRFFSRKRKVWDSDSRNLWTQDHLEKLTTSPLTPKRYADQLDKQSRMQGGSSTR